MVLRRPARERNTVMVGSDAMVTAVFKAVAGFAELPEAKLKAIALAGEIAAAFCRLSREHTESDGRWEADGCV
jgi:hypothetical protein